MIVTFFKVVLITLLVCLLVFFGVGSVILTMKFDLKDRNRETPDITEVSIDNVKRRKKGVKKC